eukprot:Em0017g909a
MPLIESIGCKEKYLQCWYADDSACAGKLSYGYFAEPTKSFLVVTKQYEEEAKELFKDHGVIVVLGHRFLGGVIGDKDSQKSYIHGKVDGWVKCVQHLSHAATKTLQAAFASMTKSLQCEWGFIQRVVPDCSDEFIVLQDTIKKCFLPALFDGSLSDAELQLFVLPTRLAGLGVLDPTSMPTEIFKTSKQGTVVIANALTGKDTFCHVSHLDALNEARQMHRKVQEDLHQSSLESILAKFTHERQRSIRRAIKDCKTGVLVIERHNEVRDCLGDMAAQVWSQVVREPIVKEADSKADGPGLRADLGIRGVWTPQVEALCDIKVIDTDAPSHLHRTPESILDTGALEKKKLYKKAVEDRRDYEDVLVSLVGQCSAHIYGTVIIRPNDSTPWVISVGWL